MMCFYAGADAGFIVTATAYVLLLLVEFVEYNLYRVRVSVRFVSTQL